MTIPIKAYLLAEDPFNKRFYVYRHKIKENIISVGSNRDINIVKIKHPAFLAKHFEIIYSDGRFFLRRIADAVLKVDGIWMEKPSMEIDSGTVIAVEDFRFCFIIDSSAIDVVLLLSLWNHDPDAIVPFSVNLVGSKRFSIGAKDADVLLKDPALENGKILIETFGPNAVLLSTRGVEGGLFIEDQEIKPKTIVRLIPGDRIVMEDYTLGVDFFSPKLLEMPETVLARYELDAYRMTPVDLRR